MSIPQPTYSTGQVPHVGPFLTRTINIFSFLPPYLLISGQILQDALASLQLGMINFYRLKNFDVPGYVKILPWPFSIWGGHSREERWLSKEGKTHPMILPAPNCDQLFIVTLWLFHPIGFLRISIHRQQRAKERIMPKFTQLPLILPTHHSTHATLYHMCPWYTTQYQTTPCQTILFVPYYIIHFHTIPYVPYYIIPYHTIHVPYHLSLCPRLTHSPSQINLPQLITFKNAWDLGPLCPWQWFPSESSQKISKSYAYKRWSAQCQNQFKFVKRYQFMWAAYVSAW